MSNPKVLMLGSFTEEEMKVLHTICSLSKRQSLLKTELTKAVFHFRSLNFAYKKPLGKSGGTSSKEEDGSKVKPEQNGPLDSLDSFEGSNSDPPASSSESGFRFVTSNLKVLMLDLFTEEEMKVLHTIDSLLNRHSLLETQLTKAVFYLDSLNFDNKKSLGKSGGTSSKEEEGSKVRPEQNGPLDSLKKVDETKNVKTDTPIKENGNASVLDAAPSYLCSSNGVKKDEKDHCDFSSAEAEDDYLDEFPTLTLQNGITEFSSKASNGALPLATKLLPRRVFFLPK